MRKIRFELVILLFLLLFGASTKPTYAYLDPGSGSYILQLLIAGGVGALFTVKTFWLQIKNFFTNLFRRKKEKKGKEKSASDQKNENGSR